MKHMKKSMFITTLLMVVLLVVALSTATFAWFSANNTVTAQQATMTAATSSAANIQISWDNETWGSTISFENDTDLQPSVPKMRPVITDTAIPAQYVVTSTNYEGGLDFSYAGHTVPYINVLDVNMDHLVLEDDVDIEAFPGLTNVGALAPLARLYKLQHARERFFMITTSTLPDASVNKIEINGNEYSYIFVTSDTTVDNNVAIEDIDNVLLGIGESSNLYASGAAKDAETTTSAIEGYRIYDVKPISEIHTLYPIGSTYPTTFVNIDGESTADPGEIPYKTVVSVPGLLDTELDSKYYINLADVNDTIASGLGPVREGDKIYMVRKAGTETKTNYFDFINSNFYTDNIDANGRFRNGANLSNPVTLTRLNGEVQENQFYIKNSNAVGSKAAIVSMVATIEGPEGTSALNDIRLAVFVNDDYVGSLSNDGSTTTYYGDIVNGAASSEGNFASYNTSGDTLSNFVQIDPAQSVSIRVVVWMDGIGLTSAESGQDVNFSFTFTASQA
jgi:hypothetical protein